MAFIQTSAALGQRVGGALSADNTWPERHVLVQTLRQAAPLLGLKPPVLATLDAMLSCLPPRRSHNTVFASNATLTFRRNGISDRTIRRHVIALQEAGLLRRHDSPNGKRYTRHNKAEGTALRFGFDLSPLFDRLQQLAQLAAEALREQDLVRYLQCKVRVCAHRRLATDPQCPIALSALKALRRKLDSEALRGLLVALDVDAGESPADPENLAETTEMSANSGQDVRHPHRSSKEHIDKTPADEALSIPQLLSACPEAAQFAPRSIETKADVIAHARTLAPMMGIDCASYDAAQTAIGPVRAAITVWVLLQFQDRIRSLGAYFRSLTSGSRSADFDPFVLIRRLQGAERHAA